MSDWQIPFLLVSAVIGWALAAALLIQRNQWRAAYEAQLNTVLDLLSEIARPVEPTPHQKAAETKRRRQIERMRAHRLDMEADIARREGRVA